MTTPKRKLGDKGEDLAANFLIQKGYRIVERNFLVRQGEIDLVAQLGDELVFVEVKTRTNSAFGDILESITPQKIERMEHAIYRYLDKHHISDTALWRIDFITVQFSGKTPHIEHFENALA